MYCYCVMPVTAIYFQSIYSSFHFIKLFTSTSILFFTQRAIVKFYLNVTYNSNIFIFNKNLSYKILDNHSPLNQLIIPKVFIQYNNKYEIKLTCKRAGYPIIDDHHNALTHTHIASHT